MKKLIMVALLATSCAWAGENSDNVFRINSESVQTFPGMGPVCLSYNGHIFTVYHEGKAHNVAVYDTDPLLQLITKEHLEKFLAQGSIRVNRLSDGSYKLTAVVPGNGGLFPAAIAAYAIVKGIGFAVPVVVGIKCATNLMKGNGDPALARGASSIGSKAAEKMVGNAIGNANMGNLSTKAANVYVELRGPHKAAQDVSAVASVGAGYYATVEAVACAAYDVCLLIPWF